jgi:PAS domain S-box-containing protein
MLSGSSALQKIPPVLPAGRIQLFALILNDFRGRIVQAHLDRYFPLYVTAMFSQHKIRVGFAAMMVFLLGIGAICRLETGSAREMEQSMAWVSGIGFLAAFCFVGISGYFVQRDRRRRRAAERERDRLFLLSQDWSCVAHVDGYFKQISPSVVASLGWSEQEFLSRPNREFIHPEDWDVTCSQIERQVDSGEKIFHFENRYRHKDGSWRWLSWNSISQPDGFLYCTARDVTELRCAQEAQAHLAALVQSSEDAIVSETPDGVISSWNQGAERLFGYQAEEILGTPLSRLFAPEAGELERDICQKVIQGERISHYETVRVAKDGRQIAVSISISPVRDKEGRVLGVSRICRDITERKRAQEELSRLNQELEKRVEERAAFTQKVAARLQGLLASAPGVLYSCRANDLVPTFISENVKAILGYGPEAFIEHPEFWAESLHPEDRARVIEDLQGGVERGRHVHEYRFKTADGSYRWIHDEFTMPAGPEGAALELVGVMVDITERKQSEEALEESRERVRMATEVGKVGIWEWDLDTQLDHWNAQMFRIYGVEPTADGVVPYSLWSGAVFEPDYLLQQPLIQETIDQRGQNTSQFRIRRANDGAERVIEAVRAVRVDASGKVKKVFGTNMDITERKQAEQALQASEEKHRLLIENLHAGVMVHAPDTSVLLVNEQACALLGVPREQLLGRNADTLPWNFLREDGSPMPLEESPLMRVLATHRLIRDQVLGVVHPGGKTVWILVNKFSQLDSQGALAQVVTAFVDITEQKLALEALKESERFAHAALDSLTAHVAILDEHGVILTTNRRWDQFAEHNGLSPAAVGPGVNYLAVLRANQQNATAQQAQAGILAVISGQKEEFALEYDCHSSNEKRWFVCRISRFQGEGPVRVVVAHENITQVKLLQKQQLRADRLESLGRLAGGIAHDLNNALTPVLMGMEILRMEQPEQSEMLDSIETSCQHAADMVRQLLTFAKGAEGACGPLQITSLIQEIKSIAQKTFPKNIEVAIHCDKELPLILGDGTQLHQVLLNLCVNARDAMPHGGHLTLSADLLTVDAVYAASIPGGKPGTFVVVSVRDTGAGMEPEVLEHIFEPFFSTKGPDKGTGLGLATVLGVVNGLGGFLQVSSEFGKGSTFSIYLPLAREGESIEPAQIAPLPFRGRGQTILFVDDEETVQQVGARVLERLNFKSLLASDGAEAIWVAAEHRAELSTVVLDMHMPHMDGIAFTRALRRILPQLPIIVMSGRFDDAIKSELEGLGVTEFLDKPFTESQLSEVLRRVLG